MMRKVSFPKLIRTENATKTKFIKALANNRTHDLANKNNNC